jgi:thiosulfate dehydrogenase
MDMPGTGVPKIDSQELPHPIGDEHVYRSKCIACHRASGEGISGADGQLMFPALWGDPSFNVGAGMARLDTAAAFVKWNIPRN